MIYFARLLFLVTLTVTSLGGCASYKPPVSTLPWLTKSPSETSQTLVATNDYAGLWEAVAEAVGQTFVIAHEEPVRLQGNILTEGRLETEPKIASSVLEPWHNDSVTTGDRIESTFQTIRRRAVVRVVPEDRGFLVQVVVYCEMEDLSQPIRSHAGATLFQESAPTQRVVQQAPEFSQSNGWFMIPNGRDPGLEKQILSQILYRFKNPPNLVRAAEPELF